MDFFNPDTRLFHRINSRLLAISCNETFTPTRSTRAPSVASSLRHRNGEPYAARPLQRKDLTSPPRRPRFHEIAPRAAPRTPSRKGMRSAAPKMPSIYGPP